MAGINISSGTSHDETDFLEELVMAEERFSNEGFKEGIQQGEQSGFDTGWRFGVQKGTEVGSELGFYHGFTETMVKLLRDERDSKESQKIEAAECLLKMIKKFPLDDATLDGFWENLKKIRAKFKQVSSLLKVNVMYTKTDGQPGINF